MVRLTTIRGSDPFLTEVKHTPLVIACPFKDGKKTVQFHEDNESDEDDEYYNEEREEQVEDYRALRISTRARLTYNLERYNKNIMLIFNAGAAVVEDRDRIPERVATIIETFSKFQFEIETHLELTGEQISVKCQEFFEADFSDYGCVAVVVLSLEGVSTVRPLSPNIVRHWAADGNPTLQHKPKIYIDESSLRLAHREHLSPYHTPITEDHPDVFWLHLPAIFHLNEPQPFQIFCAKLNEMVDYDDLMTITKVAIKETKPLYRHKIDVASTLTKKLFLQRNDAQITRL